MADYLKCKEQAELIYEEFHKAIKSHKKRKFFVEYPDVEKLCIQEPILILGLNPSGGDDEPKKERSVPNLLSYIPPIDGIINRTNDTAYEKAMTLTYKPYFKTYVESFRSLKPAYNPVWFNEAALQDIFDDKQYHKLFDKDVKQFLKSFTTHDNKHYIIFADLIQYQRTNSKEVIKHFNEETIPLINKYLATLLEFIKPKLVLSANAYVSHYLLKHAQNDKLVTEAIDNNDATYIDIYGTRIFLASMLTGQRAMDVFSLIRLFNEIQDHINSQSAIA